METDAVSTKHPEVGIQVSCPDCAQLVFVKMQLEDKQDIPEQLQKVLTMMVGATKHYSFEGNEVCPHCSKNIMAVLTVSVHE